MHSKNVKRGSVLRGNKEITPFVPTRALARGIRGILILVVTMILSSFRASTTMPITPSACHPECSTAANPGSTGSQHPDPVQRHKAPIPKPYSLTLNTSIRSPPIL